MENQLWGPGCPWYGMYEKFGEANVKWCEERICSWINEPANSWSNLAYLIIAIWIFFYSKKNRTPLGQLYAVLFFTVGSFSFFYHASNNYFSQILDFLGMYFIVYLLLVINLLRLKWITQKSVVPVFLALVGFSTAMIPISKSFDLPYQIVIVLSVVAISITEILNQQRDRKNNLGWKVWPFWASIGIYAIAACFSAADVRRVYCHPENHFIQGHAIWHVLSAIGLGVAFLYYKQFLPRRQ